MSFSCIAFVLQRDYTYSQDVQVGEDHYSIDLTRAEAVQDTLDNIDRLA